MREIQVHQFHLFRRFFQGNCFSRQKLADKMGTLGNANTLHTKRQALGFVTKRDVVSKLFDEIAPKYSERNGGYTRVIKIGPRRGDAAEMAVLELVD